MPRFGRDFDGDGRNLDISRVNELKLSVQGTQQSLRRLNGGTHNEKGTPFDSIDDMKISSRPSSLLTTWI